MIDFKQEVMNRKEELLNDLKTLCQIPSVLDPSTAGFNQPFGEANRRVLDAMLAIGKRDGFEVDDVNGYAGHIDIGEGEKTLGILGHLDVVPANVEGWTYPAYDMTIDGDFLYGRGVADDKGPLLAAYYGAKIVNEMDFDKKMKIRVIFGCAEETGSDCVRHYFKVRPYPDLGFTPDAGFPVVYGEKALAKVNLSGDFEKDKLIGLYGGTAVNIVPAEAEAIVKGECRDYRDTFYPYLRKHGLEGDLEEEGNATRLVVKGVSAHGSVPELGVNAIVYLCHYLNTVIDNEFVDFIDEYFYKDVTGEKIGIDCPGIMGHTSVNLGKIVYKNQHGVINLDVRTSYELAKEDFFNRIDQWLKDSPFDKEINYENALYVDPESDLIQKLHRSYVEFTGDTTNGPTTMGGGTYAKEMPNCVAFGCEFPGRDNKMHQNDELINLDELLTSAAIYAKAIYDLIKAD
ncbi:MAG: dipeptidase PepV [Erysipelotrichaceae bacterium]|nr:dipeptidase PepV [Erysipelotrichaceae bacterium]